MLYGVGVVGLKIMEALRNAKIPNTEIVEISHETSGSFKDLNNLPPFIRIVWKNSFGEDSEIYTELWLPDDWCGLFVALGNGGMAGALHSDCHVGYVKKGIASVLTDMGTSGSRLRGVNNPTLWKDFMWRSTHLMSEVGKQFVEIRYGKAPEYSYYVGASTGGNQGMSMVQKYPHDFDGVIVGVPASNRVFLHIYMLWNYIHLRKPDGSVMFTPDEVSSISDAAAKFFQSKGDGEVGDSFVSYPYCGKNTVAEFLEFLKKDQPNFTGDQIEALRAVYEGPKDSVTGRQIYNGMPIGSEIYPCGLLDCQREEAPFFDPFKWVFGADYTGYEFDFHDDVEKFSDCLSKELNANDPDISEFVAHGGKLIAFSASSDPCVPYPDAMRYCERVQGRFGGYEKTSEFYRWFLFPGMDHGAGGRGSNAIKGKDVSDGDWLEMLRRWREDGEAPEHLTAARYENGELIFARKIYPYGSNLFPITDHVPTCDEYYLEK